MTDNDCQTANTNNHKLEFKKITHADMPVIWEYIHHEKGRTTDFSYAGIFMWVDLFKYEYAVANDTLFIKGVVENHRDTPAFSMPVGHRPLKESVQTLKDYCRSNGLTLEFSAVPEYALEDFKALNPTSIEPLDDWSDYLYDAAMLATLTGKKMNKKRNHVNHFTACNPDWRFEPLNTENAAAAQAFMDIYDLEVDDNFMAHEESRLSRKMIDMIAEGDPVMHGGILYNRPGEICALTIGDVKGDTLYVHIEKATRHISGSYEMVNKEFASHVLEVHPEVKFINREDDSGDEGLRKAKESYHPVDLLKKYNIIF